MNKTQLLEQLKKPEDQLDALLRAAAISTDLEDYTDEHLKTLQEIDKIVESGKAKTYKEAAKLYRKQQEPTAESDQAVESPNNLDEFIQEQASRAAEATLANLPQVAQEERKRLEAVFVQKYRQRVAELVQDPGYREKFQMAMEGQDMGKSNLLNGKDSNIALLNNSSSSS